jgi:SMC interacting uncharacterized protein involved in chromosome segregation
MVDREVTRAVLNSRYVSAIEHLIKTFTLKNKREFAAKMDESPTILSAIKSGHRNASITQLAKLVNDFDLNANFFLKVENENEPVEYSGLNISPNITGNNQDVTVGKSVAKNDGVVHGNFYNVDKLINESSPEIQNHIRELQGKYENLEKEKDRFKDEVSELKKIINSMTIQIQEANAQIKEKDERLYQAQCELIEVYKKQKK